jgi:DNA-binding MarR family transcriptional regulator
MPGYMPHYLSRLMNMLNLQLLEHLRPLDITIQQFRVMQVLMVRSVASVGEIARDTVIEQSVISRIVDQLERRGYAKRRRSAGNARIVEVTLTQEGAAAYRAIRPRAQAIVKDATGVLSKREADILIELLARMFQHVGGAPLSVFREGGPG